MPELIAIYLSRSYMCSSSLCTGLPPLDVPCPREDERCEISRSVLPDNLTYRATIHRIQTDGSLAVARKLDPEKQGEDNAISTMIHGFDTQLRESHFEPGNYQRKFVT